MTSFFLKLWAVVQAKGLYIISLSWAVSFLFPLKEFIYLTGFLVAFDTITGMLAAKKRGEKITSRGFYRTVEKSSVYLMAILAAAGLHRVFISASPVDWFQNLPIVQIVAGSICFTEFLSFRENVEAITGVDVLGGLKKVLSKFLDAMPTPNNPKE